MAAPSIDSVSASLCNCSLKPEEEPPPPPADAIVELNSDVSLPYHWEQYLDLKTGRLHYINWLTGAKSTEDPRKVPGLFCNGYSSGEEEDDGGFSDEEAAEDEEELAGETRSDDDYGSCCSYVASSTSPSSSFSTSSGGAADRGDGSPPVLIAAGCPACIMYVMIPKTEEKCPRCGGLLSFFGCS
ncbi:unnamed protein product [Spirodela intermedia]|uniref:GIR1-like zinc ribbon domain-containing protein n=1 Tax=Spirodela intermedia TaxID=51605 RepID=A0A7I8L5S0_SPIIN|nr:unnamed protein product [Spirodela intermedia]